MQDLVETEQGREAGVRPMLGEDRAGAVFCLGRQRWWLWLGSALAMQPGSLPASVATARGHLSFVPVTGPCPVQPSRRSTAGATAASGLSQVSLHVPPSAASMDVPPSAARTTKTSRLCWGIAAGGNPLLSQALGSSRACLRLLCPVVLLIL